MISLFLLVVVFAVAALVLAVLKQPGTEVALKLCYLFIAIIFVIILIQVIFGVSLMPIMLGFML